jgi:hypothetical protein
MSFSGRVKLTLEDIDSALPPCRKIIDANKIVGELGELGVALPDVDETDEKSVIKLEADAPGEWNNWVPTEPFVNVETTIARMIAKIIKLGEEVEALKSCTPKV